MKENPKKETKKEQINKKLLNVLACPKDKSDLVYDKEKNNKILLNWQIIDNLKA